MHASDSQGKKSPAVNSRFSPFLVVYGTSTNGRNAVDAKRVTYGPFTVIVMLGLGSTMTLGNSGRFPLFRLVLMVLQVISTASGDYVV
jgi:hypothetical protein